MKTRLLVYSAIFCMIVGTGCYKGPNSTLIQQKGKAQTEILQLLQQIDSLENAGEINYDIYQDFITKAETFCGKYPEAPMSAEFLYKAGLMAMTVAKVAENIDDTDMYCQRALAIFDEIQKVYPDFNGVKNCILNKGIVYEDILHDYETAEILYREFIARYPTDTLAINLESYLPYLGKSSEEIMLEFGNK